MPVPFSSLTFKSKVRFPYVVCCQVVCVSLPVYMEFIFMERKLPLCLGQVLAGKLVFNFIVNGTHCWLTDPIATSCPSPSWWHHYADYLGPLSSAAGLLGDQTSIIIFTFRLVEYLRVQYMIHRTLLPPETLTQACVNRMAVSYLTEPQCRPVTATEASWANVYGNRISAKCLHSNYNL